MAADEVKLVEMKELNSVEVQDDKDAAEGTTEGTTDVKLPAESKQEPTADVYRRVRLYKWASFMFLVLSLILLAVVLCLAVKLYDVQSIQNCPENPEVKKLEELNCSREVCQAMYPSTQAVQKDGYRCSKCENGWLMLNNTCYFLSNERLNWQESREACQKKGGDLGVINNEHVQKILSKEGVVLYWIGLRFSEKQKWMWINNTALTHNYWAHNQPEPDSQGFCALLKGQASYMNNWYTNRCLVTSHYICQRGY